MIRLNVWVRILWLRLGSGFRISATVWVLATVYGLVYSFDGLGLLPFSVWQTKTIRSNISTFQLIQAVRQTDTRKKSNCELKLP
jgi:hypothetical protein